MRGTQGVLEGYSRGTRGVLVGYFCIVLCQIIGILFKRLPDQR